MYRRAFVAELEQRLESTDPLIQVVLGPRQVGKTTGVQQLIESLNGRGQSVHYTTADLAIGVTQQWLEQACADALAQQVELLAIDEIQKIVGWSSVIKRFWDTTPRTQRPKLVLLGSSSLDIHVGLTESLAGRFELLNVRHWGFKETRQVFGLNLEHYLNFGGYPGAIARFDPSHDGFDIDRWMAYLNSSIVDSVIGKDILSQRSVRSPALFKQVFALVCSHPAQVVSYSKLLGQLQDKGNTDSIKHYLQMYEQAYLCTLLPKYFARSLARQTSSPKILPAAPCFFTLYEGRAQPIQKLGFSFEAVVGNALIEAFGTRHLYYWRSGKGHEVDFVLRHRGVLHAFEVKSGRVKSARNGLMQFASAFSEHEVKTYVIDRELFEQRWDAFIATIKAA